MKSKKKEKENLMKRRNFGPLVRGSIKTVERKVNQRPLFPCVILQEDQKVYTSV